MSLWTGATKFRLDRDQLLIATLAHQLARLAFPSVRLCTDTAGSTIAAILGWEFSEVYTLLNALSRVKTPHIWSLGKLVAMADQESPVCHVDFDVYLHQGLPARIKTARLHAQSPDWPHYYISPCMDEGMRIAGLGLGGYAYNAGIIGGADIGLLREYAEQGIAMAEKFEGKLLEDGTCISMLVEQYWLGAFAIQNRVTVETLLPMNPTSRDARRAGFTHLHGSSKENPLYIRRSEARLEEQFPQAYRRFMVGIHDMQSEGLL